MRLKQLLIFIVATFMLTSCDAEIISSEYKEWEQTLNREFLNTDRQQAHDYFLKIIEKVENRDMLAMRNLFSDTVSISTPDIDSQISMLFEFCIGELVSYTESGPGAHSKRDNGVYYKEIYTTYDFATTEGNYRMAFLFCAVDSENPENIGIHSIFIIKAEDSDRSYAYWGDDEWIPGITIQRGSED